MIINGLEKVERISSELLDSCSMNPNLEPEISYSSSNAVFGLELCINEMHKVVDLMASNMKIDSINILKIGLALEKADLENKKGDFL